VHRAFSSVNDVLRQCRDQRDEATRMRSYAQHTRNTAQLMREEAAKMIAMALAARADTALLLQTALEVCDGDGFT
jgi:hypothetical protein